MSDDILFDAMFLDKELETPLDLVQVQGEDQYKKFIKKSLEKAKSEAERDSILKLINYKIEYIPSEYITMNIACDAILKDKNSISLIPEEIQNDPEFINFFIENADRILFRGQLYLRINKSIIFEGYKETVKSDALRLFLELYL